MMNAIWFSRHEPTPEQIRGIQAGNYQLVAVEDGKKLGSVELVTEADVRETLDVLSVMVVAEKAEAIFGVFPPPVQVYQKAAGCGCACFSSWNIKRSVEGQPPTFQHQDWCYVGDLLIGEWQNGVQKFLDSAIKGAIAALPQEAINRITSPDEVTDHVEVMWNNGIPTLIVDTVALMRLPKVGPHSVRRFEDAILMACRYEERMVTPEIVHRRV